MSSVATWPTQAENWLDEKGKAAWIIAMVLGFMIFWPIGLGILFYMKWSNRMFAGKCRKNRRHNRNRHHSNAAYKPSGNSAFDAYKEDTLRRLEEEQGNFEAFLERLRDAKDKSEFDDFMDQRAKKATELKEPVEA